MELSSLTFVAFALLVALCANAFPSPNGRAVVMALASAVFIASYASSVVQVLPLLLFLVLGFVVVRAVQLRPARSTLVTGLVAIVASFLYLKRYAFVDNLPALPFIYLSLGLSYILFRIIHLAVDASQNELPTRVGPLSFFNYTCNFLSFVSGPIQRYQDYQQASAQRLTLDDDTAYTGFSRVVLGYIKVAVISAIADHLFTIFSLRLAEQAGVPMLKILALYLAAATTYTAYLYYNFAGYMDIVIGIGRLCGCNLPENFNKPFSSRNFLEFWSRWHMTLSDWFKLYVFNPLLKLMARHVQAAALQPFLGVAAFFLTFLLIGMWHGTTTAFFIYGLVLGAGASGNKLWQVVMTRRLGKQRYKTTCANPLYAALCTGMTFAYFAMALGCFWMDAAQLVTLARSLGVSGVLLAFAALSVVGGGVLWAVAEVSKWLASRRPLTSPRTSDVTVSARGVLTSNMLLGARVLMIACVASFFHKAPEFVYRAF